MSISRLHLIWAGSAFVLIFLCGFVLSNMGKPYGAGILTVHKLLSLGMLIWLGVTTHRMNQTVAVSATELLTVVAAGMFFVGTMGAGGLLTIGKPMPPIVHRLHRIAPYVTALTSAAAVFLLSRR